MKKVVLVLGMVVLLSSCSIVGGTMGLVGGTISTGGKVIGGLIGNKNGEININLVNNNNQISFSIADKGIGISPVDIDKIFNSFYRSDVTNHAEIKGTGLGLSIVKRLCDLLKLEIAVESKLNHGTTFILSFPLAKLK